jgi:hypothetical protein
MRASLQLQSLLNKSLNDNHAIEVIFPTLFKFTEEKTLFIQTTKYFKTINQTIK